jgi:rRNA-processing protein FCF1
MLLLISDANVLIDIEHGGLSSQLFRLEFDFAVPDTLFEEELRERHAHLLEMGLNVLAVDADGVQFALNIGEAHRRASSNDLLALALARQHKCMLVTGDKALRAAAVAQHIELRGTLWLVEQLVISEQISYTEARDAYSRMRAVGSRLPWPEVAAQLRGWGCDPI